MLFDQKKVILIVLLFVAIFVGITYTRRGDDATTEGLGSFTDPSLKFVAVMFRHGDRAPIFQFKTNPHANAFPEGIGELTKKGKQHMYKKGQILRRMYNGYISDLYLDNEIIIKSTYMRRAHMSAQMVVAGMYPPKNYQKWSDLETIWQPIPVYTDSPDHGTLFVDVEKGKCPYFSFITNEMLIKFVKNYDKNITEPLLLYLTEKCEQPITDKTLIKLYDLFMCQMSEGLPLPEWIKPHHIEKMKLTIMNKTNLEEFYGNEMLQKLIVGPLLTEIGLSMELNKNNSNHNTTRKMHLYAGHDISLASAMGFLGHIIEMPKFGASLHFHLYHNETIGYNIKVFYYDQWNNEKGEEISILSCNEPCKIQDFMKLLTNNLSVKWEEECQKVEIEI